MLSLAAVVVQLSRMKSAIPNQCKKEAVIRIVTVTMFNRKVICTLAPSPRYPHGEEYIPRPSTMPKAKCPKLMIVANSIYSIYVFI